MFSNPLLELQKALTHLCLDPQPKDQHLEELSQQYETVLTLLESEFLGALMSGDWSEFDQFVNDFRVEASTKNLNGSGADLLPTTELTDEGDKPIMPDEFLYIEFALSCDGDKSKILAVAAEALTHVNAHSEAAIVHQILDKAVHEAAMFDALFDVAFGRGQQ